MPYIVSPEMACLLMTWTPGTISDGAVTDLIYTAAVLGEQREAVLKLHAPIGVPRSGPVCPWCDVRYPCPTARALGVEE